MTKSLATQAIDEQKHRWFKAEMVLQEGAARGAMSTEYASRSTEIGERDKNNKSSQAITYNYYLAAQNILKRAEKYKVEEGRESLISLYRKNTSLAFSHTSRRHSDTSLFWKLLPQTALPNNEQLKHLLHLLTLSLPKPSSLV